MDQKEMAAAADWNTLQLSRAFTLFGQWGVLKNIGYFKVASVLVSGLHAYDFTRNNAGYFEDFTRRIGEAPQVDLNIYHKQFLREEETYFPDHPMYFERPGDLYIEVGWNAELTEIWTIRLWRWIGEQGRERKLVADGTIDY